MRLKGLKNIKIMKVHRNTCVKWVSAADLSSSTKQRDNLVFDYSNAALAELLEKTCSKCKLTTIHITSKHRKHTRTQVQNAIRTSAMSKILRTTKQFGIQ